MKDNGQSGRKITVAHFMPWNEIGGVEVATLRLTDTTKHLFRHVAFCLHDATALRNFFEKSDIETIPYNPPTPSLRHAGRFYKESLAVAHQITRAGADIVHFADQKAAYHNSLAALIARVQIVCHLRSTYSELSLRDRLCFLPIHSFIFVSKEARRSLDEYLPENKTRVIYDAVEVSNIDISESNAAIRHELGVPLGSSLIGMVARVAPVKDYFTLASAAVKILEKYPDTRFLIVGDNARVDLNRHHYQEVLQKLRELNIADKFIFTGHRNDVPQLIAAMDICVLCTHREGFPLSILESMSMRKPFVATAVGGIPEIVEPGVTGYLHQHGNSHELAAAIMALIEDPELADRIGTAAFENVRQNYSRDKFTHEIATAYSETLRQ
jgi:glycosyltransferase involved in cell wall biosynthesis